MIELILGGARSADLLDGPGAITRLAELQEGLGQK